jgi:hypothetical protein
MNARPSEVPPPAEATKPAPLQSAKGKPLSRAKANAAALEKADPEARRRAAAILEVLAGARSPSQAAAALSLSPMRYYFFEMRALKGLVEACNTPPKGRALTPESELAKLRKRFLRLERECARYAALARMSQRAVNLAPPPPLSKSSHGAKKVRRRHPPRALKLAAALQKGAASAPPQGSLPAPKEPAAQSAAAAPVALYKEGTAG